METARRVGEWNLEYRSPLTDGPARIVTPVWSWAHECNAWCESEEVQPDPYKRQHCSITYWRGYPQHPPVDWLRAQFFQEYKYLFNIVHFEEAKKAPPPNYSGYELQLGSGGVHTLKTQEELDRLGTIPCYRYWYRLHPTTIIVPPAEVKKEVPEKEEDDITPFTG